MPGIPILPRYIFTSVLYSCIGAIALFTFAVVIPNIARELAGPVAAGQVDIPTFLRLVLLVVPFAFSYSLPMGALLGVLLAMGRMSADREITAMRSAGIGLRRIARPVLTLGLLGTALALWINFSAMPWARVRYHTELSDALRTRPVQTLVPRTFIRDFRGFVIYLGDRNGLDLKDVWVWQLDSKDRVVRMLHAASGRLAVNAARDSLTVSFARCVIEERDPEAPEDLSKAPSVATSEHAQEIQFPFAAYLPPPPDDVRWLPLSRLYEKWRQLARDRTGSAEVAQQRMELSMAVNEKLNLAAAVLTFALVGVPLGVWASRKETSANLGISLLIVLGFYITSMAIKSLDNHPELRPDLMLWIPNGIVMLVSLACYRVARIG